MDGFDHKSGSTLNIKGADIYFEVHGDRKMPVLLFLHRALWMWLAIASFAKLPTEFIVSRPWTSTLACQR